MMDYDDFLKRKVAVAPLAGFDVDPQDISPLLWRHQPDVVRWALRRGRAAIFAAFGLGKTLMQCEILRLIQQREGGRSLIILPLGVRQEFTRDAKKLGVPLTFIRSTDEVTADGIYLTNYESVRDGKLDVTLFTAVSLDEASCFAKGTMVACKSGLKPIETIEVGEVILNAYGEDKVRATHKNLVKRVARIHVGGNTILASHDHRFFTESGWKTAATLQPGDCLVETAEAMRILRSGHSPSIFRGSHKAILQSILRSEMASDAALHSSKDGEEELQTSGTSMSVVHEKFYGRPRRDIQTILLKTMFCDMENDATKHKRKSSQSHSRSQKKCSSQQMVEVGCCESTTGAHSQSQSNEQSHFSRENETLSFRENVSFARGQRHSYEASAAFIKATTRCSNGICNRDESGQRDVPLASQLLQGRYCNPVEKDCGGSRWEHASTEEVDFLRQEKNICAQRTRVDSVEILESGHPDLDRYREADGELYFYDLSATWHPSYSVNSFLVHNCLRSYGSKTYQEFLTLFATTKYRFVATATPSPNRYKELIHYAGFLGVMDTGQALTRFFQRDSKQANNLTLYPHMEAEFFTWLHSWALFIQKPSDLGYSDEGYALPPLQVHYHEVPVRALSGGVDRDGQVQLIRDAALGLKEAAKEKSDSIAERITKMQEILRNDPDSHYLLWHDLEAERHAIKKAVPTAAEVYGSLDLEERERRVIDFSDGKIQYMASKPELSGSGCNFQRHCHKAIFLGIGYKFNDFIQSIHRIYRFLQEHPCEIHVIYMETEREILAELQRKWADDTKLRAQMAEIIQTHGLATTGLEEGLHRTMGVTRRETVGARFVAVHHDCVEETRTMADHSIDLIHTSIPFGNHYEYSESYRDFGHNQDNAKFFEQMDFLTPELLRVLRPGRVAAIHVKDRIRFGNVTGYGMPSVDPFHADCIAHYRRHGFIYMGMITVVTDVVRENNQTYRLGWSEQCKDGTKMGVGSPEYILLFRKLPTDTSRAYADVPVTKTKAEYTRARWQVDAHAFWRSSGNRFLTAADLDGLGPDDLASLFTKTTLGTIYDYAQHVQVGEALERQNRLPATFMAIAPGSHHPEVWHDVNRMLTLNTEQSRRNVQQHVCPLQIDIVDRILTRYTNPDEVVYDPFGGLMTVPCRAVKLGRRGIGCELNAEYYRDGVRYLQLAEAEASMPTLFDMLEPMEAKTA